MRRTVATVGSATVRRTDVAVKYYIKVVVGLDLFLLGTIAFCYGLYGLTRGAMDDLAGPLGAQSTTWENPSGLIALIVAGTFVGLIGVLVASFRGDPPNASPYGRPNWIEALGTGLTSWGVFFVAVGGTALLAGFGPGSHDVGGMRLTLAILGGVFIVMGAVPLVLAVRWAFSDRRSVPAASEGKGGATVPLSLRSTVASLYQTANYLSSHPEVMKPPRAAAIAEVPDEAQRTPAVGAGERPPANSPAVAVLPTDDGGTGEGFEGGRTAAPGPVAAPPAPDAPEVP